MRPSARGRTGARAGAALVVIALALAALVLPSPASAAGVRDGRIAFTRGGDVYTVAPTGTGLQRLTTTGGNQRPRWSPDGRRLSYAHSTPAGARDVWVMDADGSHQQQVTHRGDVDAAASWSPDGSTLVFSSPSSPLSDLQTVRSTAPFGAPVRLLGQYDVRGAPGDRALGVDGNVTWSPDGRQIAFYSHTFPDSPDSYLLLYDTANQFVTEFLVIGGDCCGFGSFDDLNWGPSGGRIGFTYFRGLGTPPPVVATQRYPSGANGVFTTVKGDRQPAFSPSGASAVLVRDGRLVVTKPYGSDRRLLTAGESPDWQALR